MSKKNIHKKHQGSYKNTNNASSLKLDDYIKKNKIKKIDFIKLDVDGHELDVLKSGYNFLKKQKVPIIFEVAPYLYEEHGYTQGCLKCCAIRLKDLDENGKRHSDKCRERLAKEIGNVVEFKVLIERANERNKSSVKRQESTASEILRLKERCLFSKLSIVALF